MKRNNIKYRDEHLKGKKHIKKNKKEIFSTYFPAALSFFLLVTGLLLDLFEVSFFEGFIRLSWYILAYIPVGFPVLKNGIKNIWAGDFFTEFFLMSIATIGAFAIKEYPEGVAVMLFYTVGELFQEKAVKRAKSSIKSLLDVRPNIASVWRDNRFESLHPEKVKIGEKIQVKPGEKIPLDGKLLSDKARLNTAALTGESKPRLIRKNEQVLSGAINLEGLIEIETTKVFKDSAVARIIDLVQNASARKSKTELFIRKFARIYTPIVVFAALALTFLPYFFIEDYIFNDWLYRALVFLVISCPCALVVSIPLGYFGGLGAASANGILFKGASFLDKITKINTLVVDKTGTLTKGVFKIQKVETVGIDQSKFFDYLLALESKSTHPIAKAILAEIEATKHYEVKDLKEISGKGLVGVINGKQVLAGNPKLMEQYHISFPKELETIVASVVGLAIDNKYVGYITLADELKEDAKASLEALKNYGIKEIIMLSGDTRAIVREVAAKLDIDNAKGEMLPQDKLRELTELKKDAKRTIAFVGDGINDSPVLAGSDVGIAMGALGSDVAIDTADVVIQTDQLSKILQGIQIGKSTRYIVWQNIGMAFGVKALVLLLGAMGSAGMWEAVFADVGVALLAILNAVRLQKKKF